VNLKQYVPVSIGVFIAVVLIARYLGIPAAPWALVLLLGETIIGLQVEDQRVLHFLEDLFRAFRSTPKHH